MKRRYAYNKDDNYKQIKIETCFFQGYACFLKLQNITKPLIVNNGKESVCIKDNNYEWIEVYPLNEKYAITIIFDDNNNLIEWYFDIAEAIGLENGIPYEDDLYLDMIITPNGEKIIIDENELLAAYEVGDISKSDLESAYQTLKYIENKYANNLEELIKFTKYLCELFNKAFLDCHYSKR